MTLQEIKLLFAYDNWANERIFEAVSALSEADYTRDLKSSHGGVQGTLTHIVATDKIWLSRWVGNPEMQLMAVSEAPTLADLKDVWEDVARRTAKFLGALNDKKVLETFSWTSPKGDCLTHVYAHAFQHVVNHSTYHRGQITSFLRQLGAKPAGTDLITFYRQTSR
jgi:uncharacterized damage-inducible protein DinB